MSPLYAYTGIIDRSLAACALHLVFLTFSTCTQSLFSGEEQHQGAIIASGQGECISWSHPVYLSLFSCFCDPFEPLSTWVMFTLLCLIIPTFLVRLAIWCFPTWSLFSVFPSNDCRDNLHLIISRLIHNIVNINIVYTWVFLYGLLIFWAAMTQFLSCSSQTHGPVAEPDQPAPLSDTAVTSVSINPGRQRSPVQFGPAVTLSSSQPTSATTSFFIR